MRKQKAVEQSAALIFTKQRGNAQDFRWVQFHKEHDVIKERE